MSENISVKELEEIFNIVDKNYTKEADSVSKFNKITIELLDIYEKKNKDYGNSFSEQYKEYGLSSSLIRLDDKMRRLKNLNKVKSQNVKDESIIDTLSDLANYAIMTIMELKEE